MRFDLGAQNFQVNGQVGNINAKLKYEQWVPPSYRKVDSSTPQVYLPLIRILIVSKFPFQTLVEQWIFAKYGREEFIHPERQSYTSGFMEVSTYIFSRERKPFTLEGVKKAKKSHECEH